MLFSKSVISMRLLKNRPIIDFCPQIGVCISTEIAHNLRGISYGVKWLKHHFQIFLKLYEAEFPRIRDADDLAWYTKQSGLKNWFQVKSKFLLTHRDLSQNQEKFSKYDQSSITLKLN